MAGGSTMAAVMSMANAIVMIKFASCACTHPHTKDEQRRWSSSGGSH
jgi:hypothetical protein